MSEAGDGTEDPSGVVGWLRWFWTTEETPAVYVRDVVTSVGAVLLVGLLLFAASGIWPPMVAVESTSMEPNMERGDLVFVMSEDRFVPDAAPSHAGESTGVVPADRATACGAGQYWSARQLSALPTAPGFARSYQFSPFSTHSIARWITGVSRSLPSRL